MKIGILTFHNAHNHGAVLQCWALQEYLKKEGYEVDIINYRLQNIEKLYRIVAPRNPFRVNILNKGFRILQFFIALIRDRNKAIKYIKFEYFIRKSLNLSILIKNFRQMKSMQFDYDALIVGSDQVWNGDITKGLNPAYFLYFGHKNTIRISYAASIGKESITKEEELFFLRYLKELDYISVRENSAKNLLKNLTPKKIDVVSDPTLLIGGNSYNRIKSDPNLKQKFIYVHNVHLKRIDESLASVAEELSKKLNLPVVHNYVGYKFKNEIKSTVGYGPKEHIGYIANADFVITNSFHTMVFSIIYKKRFVIIPHYKIPERKRYLLELLGLDNHLISDSSRLPNDINEFSYDYGDLEYKIEGLKNISRGFLDNALNSKINSKEIESYSRTYFDTEDVFTCYGCSACKDICPEKAIHMEIDEEGFWYPYIDSSKCTGCNLCRDRCIFKKYQKEAPDDRFPVVYAAHNKDKDVLEYSSSGGVFVQLCQLVIKNNGKVVGVKYDKNMNAVYDIADNLLDCKKFCGSKYVAADSKNVKKRVKVLLDKKVPVLFTGTPCQIAGLKSFLGKHYENLYTVDLICMGTPSPGFFKLYIEYLEKQYRAKVKGFQFRNKFRGWNDPYIVVNFDSEEMLIEKLKDNYYGKAFLKKINLRPSCYQCEFASLESGVSDITIGDYWGVEEQHPEIYNEKGVSIIKINNKKGLEIFNMVKDCFDTVESTYDKAYAKNHSEPSTLLISRNIFMLRLKEKDLKKLIEES